MTDLEITRLCAEAMGYKFDSYAHAKEWCKTVNYLRGHGEYNPLHDDAQAMALVKKFNLSLTKDISPSEWRAETDSDSPIGRSPDLNRAICECCAKMQRGKPA